MVGSNIDLTDSNVWT